MNGHAKFSPSSAERWLSCPGSIRLIERAPPQTDSVYAAEGTQAHACLEALLKAGAAQADGVCNLLLKANPFAMVRHARETAKVIWTDAGDDLVLAEDKVCLPGVDDLWGTLDCAVVHEMVGLLRIYDFKYGAGIPVEARENLQLICYALSKAAEYDYAFTDVELVILQPRADHVDGPVRRWRVGMNLLRGYLPKFHKGVARCKAQVKGKEELSAGKHCKFCPAKPICPAIGEQAMTAAQMSFTRIDSVPTVVPAEALPPADTLKDLGRALAACDRLEDWIAAVRGYAFDTMSRGERVPGFKLVPKRAQRRWRDEAMIEEIARKEFGDLAFEQKLLSPAQMEKQLATKVWVAAHTVSESSGLTIAEESDKRSGVDPVAMTFGVIE